MGRRARLLADAEVAKNHIQKLIDTHHAGDAAEGAQRQPEVFPSRRLTIVGFIHLEA
jgi:hypothetical protein